ncbi:hypothetical protein, partial [Aliidiomarina sp.]|uniref:hypothetical protein n=1 Tax=Aliidiomarina sp. TaxID=1872439 RepID=UPI003A4D7A0F
MKFSKKLTAAAAIVAAGFATNVAAETASDTIEVYAGLAPVLELTCTDVHFGVWRVPTGDRTESNMITLIGTTTVNELAGTATFTSSVSADGTTVAESNNYTAAAGQC